METATSRGNRIWLLEKEQKVGRYIRRCHPNKHNHEPVLHLMYKYPDEGKKLVLNYDKSNSEKLMMFLNWIIYHPVVICGVFGDQRQGKDTFLTKIFEYVLKGEKKGWFPKVRIVTLGNIKRPPFVRPDDMYFSFLNIPIGSKDQQIWIYCSEIENVLPARETAKEENKLFDQLSGTMAQNHQKLFGAVKLAYKVDINFFRYCNTKVFKFIEQSKLNIDGVERDGVLSGLGRWLLPQSKEAKDESLLAFDSNLLSVKTGLPSFWSEEYSEQYRQISKKVIWEYIQVSLTNGYKIPDIEVAVKQKFRTHITQKEIADKFKIQITNKKVSVY